MALLGGMEQVTLEQIHEDIISLREELGQVKAILEEDFELKDDLRLDIKHSRQRSPREFISHQEIKRELIITKRKAYW